MLSPVLNLALACLIILGVCWLVLWILHQFTSFPAQIDKFVWLVAVLLCLIKLAQFVGL